MQGAGCRVQVAGYRVQGAGYRAWCDRARHACRRSGCALILYEDSFNLKLFGNEVYYTV